jgi:hypothetical protein
MGEAFPGAQRPARARRIREMRRMLLAAAALAAALAASAADPVAFVADLQGNATIEGNGKVKFLTELEPGTRLLLGTGASLAVTYASSGAEFTLVGPGEFMVLPSEVRAEKGTPPKRRTVTAVKDAGVVAKAAQLASASIRMRGVVAEPPAPALLYPVNTRVASLQPELRWKEAGAAEAFTIILTDEAGKEVWKASARPSRARPAVKLSPAQRYKWTVMTPKGTVGEASFETLSMEAAGRVEKSRVAAKNFPDRVMHAFLLQEVGASQDARTLWGELAHERPDIPELSSLAR